MIKHDKAPDGEGQTTGAGEAKADGGEDLTGHALTPSQIAALRALEEQRMDEFRAKHGEGFTREQIEEMMTKAEREKPHTDGALPPAPGFDAAQFDANYPSPERQQEIMRSVLEDRRAKRDRAAARAAERGEKLEE